MRKVHIDVPAENADPVVVDALRAVARSLGVTDVRETTAASPDSYSLTIHVVPDEKKE